MCLVVWTYRNLYTNTYCTQTAYEISAGKIYTTLTPQIKGNHSRGNIPYSSKLLGTKTLVIFVMVTTIMNFFFMKIICNHYYISLIYLSLCIASLREYIRECECKGVKLKPKVDMRLHKFFKRESSLPSPNSPWVPPSAIKAVNNNASAVLSTATDSSMLDGGPYSNCQEQTRLHAIANYAVSHGTAAAIRHFKDEFPNLKWNDWKTAITDDMKKAHGEGYFEPITTLGGKKTGRPSILSDKLSK